MMVTKHSVLLVFTTFVLIACNQAQQKDQIETSQQPPTPLPEAASPIENTCNISLGFDVWEPYQYLDVDNNVRGVDIELISTAVKNMGCEVSYQQGTWVLLLDELKKGQVDLLLGASKTESREQYAYFSNPYRTEEFSLYIRKDDATRANYKDIDEFISNGSKIGIVDDYYYGPAVSIMLDGSATSKFFVSGIMGEFNVGRLLDEDIDGFLEDSFVGASMLRRKALKTYIVEHSFKIETGDIFAMFSQKTTSEEQVSKFNAELEKMRESGEFQAILDKYSR